MLETLKSYLVSLGFSVDKQSYGEATKAVDGAEKAISKFAGGAVAQFALAGSAVVGFAATALVGVAKFLDGLGKAQIENEKLARQMWISEESAMAFNSALKATGASLQDLYLSPTLASQFVQLQKEATSLRPPAEFKNQMQLIQSITFEFKRMKLEATYAMQWIGYYLIKYLQGPILNVKLTLSQINDTIVKTMPQWTKVVAQVMSWFTQFGITTVRAIKDLIRVFDDVGEAIPKNVRLIGAAISALGVIVASGPIGMVIAGITLLILLLDDFYTYLDGGESQFGPFWEKLVDLFDKFKGMIGPVDDLKKKFTDAMDKVGTALDKVENKVTDFFQTLEDNGTIDNFGQSFSDEFDLISDSVQRTDDWLVKLFDTLKQDGTLNDLYNSFVDIIKAASDLRASITGAVKEFMGLKAVQTILNAIGDVLIYVVEGSLKNINKLLDTLTSSMEVLAKLFKGDFKGALKSFEDMAKNGSFTLPNMVPPSYIFPSSNQSNTNNSKVTLNQTNNIYGPDPHATANAATDNMQLMLYRNTRGAFT